MSSIGSTHQLRGLTIDTSLRDVESTLATAARSWENFAVTTLQSTSLNPPLSNSDSASFIKDFEEMRSKSNDELKKARDILIANLMEKIKESNERIGRSLEPCINNLREMSVKFQTKASSLMEQVPLSTVNRQALNELKTICDMVGNQTVDMTKSLVKIEDATLRNLFSYAKKHLDLFFETEKIELSLYKERLTLLQENEKHKASILTTLHGEHLKKKAQEFSQKMELLKFQQKEKEREEENERLLRSLQAQQFLMMQPYFGPQVVIQRQFFLG